MHTRFWWRNLRERDYSEDLDLDGKTLIKWFFRKWDGGTYWIDLALDRDG